MRIATSCAIVPIVVIGVAACGGGDGDAETSTQAETCVPVQGPLAGPIDADALAGTYRLTMVATEGERSGQEAIGTLTLRQHAPDMQQIMMGGNPVPDARLPLYGTTDIPLDSVGALVLGDLMADDPSQPGVSVAERTGDEISLTLRLGSEANRREVRFDGGYTALRVRVIDDGGFAGRWASGTLGEQAAGDFCAVRN